MVHEDNATVMRGSPQTTIASEEAREGDYSVAEKPVHDQIEVTIDIEKKTSSSIPVGDNNIQRGLPIPTPQREGPLLLPKVEQIGHIDPMKLTREQAFCKYGTLPGNASTAEHAYFLGAGNKAASEGEREADSAGARTKNRRSRRAWCGSAVITLGIIAVVLWLMAAVLLLWYEVHNPAPDDENLLDNFDAAEWENVGLDDLDNLNLNGTGSETNENATTVAPPAPVMLLNGDNGNGGVFINGGPGLYFSVSNETFVNLLQLANNFNQTLNL
ncbi:unnamed protein product [Amoebophrya sp. A120]|nr:unnamed protein product [Amoebophrya sp. A120]|eukprot:GSA120T00004881001.1